MSQETGTGEDRKDPWYAVFRGKLPLEAETAWYILLSALDVLLTYLLLRFSTGEGARIRFYESNPVARFVLHHWGMDAMIYYKFGMVALVAVIAQIVATRRPKVARLLLLFASLAVGIVVLYSLYLLSIAIGLL